MKVVYGIGQWTNSSRAQARHIPGKDGKPICKDKQRKGVFSYEYEDGEATCKQCIRLLSKQNI